VLTIFGRLEYKKYAKEFGTVGDPCPVSEGHGVSVYCIEPLKANFERLKDRAKRSAWQLADVQFMRAGLANTSRKRSVWARPDEVDPTASLSPRPGLLGVEEKMVTVDTLVKKSVASRRVFLLRLSLNGHEHGALRGATKSFKLGLVRFVLFEVSPEWDAARYRPSEAIALLWKVGYACFALLPRPVPVSGPFWQDDVLVAGPARFHVFCGALGDPGLRRVTQILDPAAQDYFGRSA